MFKQGIFSLWIETYGWKDLVTRVSTRIALRGHVRICALIAWIPLANPFHSTNQVHPVRGDAQSDPNKSDCFCGISQNLLTIREMADQKALCSSSQKGSGQQPLVNTLPVLSVPPELLQGQRFSTRMPHRQPKMGTHPYTLKHRINNIPLFKLRRSTNSSSAIQQKPLRAIHMINKIAEPKQPAPVILQPLPVQRTSILSNPHFRRRTSTEPRPPCKNTTPTPARLTDARKLHEVRWDVPLLKCLKKRHNAKRAVAAAVPLGMPGRYATRLQPVNGRLSLTPKRAKNLLPNQNSASTALPSYICVSLSRPFESAPFGFMFNHISLGAFTSTFYIAFFRDAGTWHSFFSFQDFKSLG